MNVKYQVFISSTYDDLKEERDAVTKAILAMGHIPVGMEMFSAADEEQWRIIQTHIESSDYYVVIVAHRYGSMAGGVSYTEREYDYAIECGVPVLGFVLEDNIPWPPTRIEKERMTEVANFRAKVKVKPVGFWKSADHLSGIVSIALGKQINSKPRPGWIRGSNAASPETLAELARLSAENSKLRELAVAAKESSPELVCHIQSAEVRVFAPNGNQPQVLAAYLDTKVSIIDKADRSYLIPLDHVAVSVEIDETPLNFVTVSFNGEVAPIENAPLAALKSQIRPAPKEFLKQSELSIRWQFACLGFERRFSVAAVLKRREVRSSGAFFELTRE